ncbi:hypothetical protein Tco_0236671 [Tanacetum coccineum]
MPDRSHTPSKNPGSQHDEMQPSKESKLRDQAKKPPWQKAVRQKITQSFSPDLEISFPSLRDDEGAEGPPRIRSRYWRTPVPAYAVLSLQSLKSLKDVQKLNEKLASLNRFLAKSAEKSLPFFKTLKKCTNKSDFLWTEEAESAFKQMNELIEKLHMLIAPEEKEELIIYLAASKEAYLVFQEKLYPTMGNNFETTPSEIGVKIVHSIAFCFHKTSLDERTGRKSKQEFGGRNKSKIGQRQQELDSRSSRSKNDEALEINYNTRRKSKQAAIRESKNKEANGENTTTPKLEIKLQARRLVVK